MPVKFTEVAESITDAARKVKADEGASPVLVAVIRELQNKLASRRKRSAGRKGPDPR